MSPRSLWIFFLGAALWACSPAAGPSKPHLDLLEHITSAAGAHVTDRAPLRVGLAVPPAATLVVQADPTDSGLRIRLVDENDESELYAGRAPVEPVTLDLASWADRLVELRVEATHGEAALRTLRIDAPVASPLTDSFPRAPYNVLVIVLDSLRADHLSPYGADASDTPQLDELARKGVVFASARTNATWTRPSVVTMFSSRYPWEHGVLEPDSIFPEALPYLPELLAVAGWRSEGASGNDMVSALFGMSRGFETLYSLRKSPAYRKSRDPLDRAQFVWRELLDELTGQDTPFFAYLHQLDPHSPYKPAAPYRARYFDGSDRQTQASVENIRHLRTRTDDLTFEQVDTLARLYKGEVAFMDDYVGELVRQLELRGLNEKTLVVFTSDHGEEFYEHQSLGHGHSVYEELLHVPLILRLDGVLPAGLRVEAPVELLDLAPTILDLLGQPIPESMQGSSLLPWIEAPATKTNRVQLASSSQPAQYAIRHGSWKLVRREPGTFTPEPKYELYDLRADPREQNDLSSERTIITFALQQMLDRELANAQAGGTAPRAKIDPQTLEALKAIGYLDR